MKMRQSYNKVEITGVVGNVHEDSNFYRLGVCTYYAYKSIDGCPVIENTWHDCLIEKANIEGVPKRGTTCHITGRLRQRNYTDSNGKDILTYQIVGEKGSIESDEK